MDTAITVFLIGIGLTLGVCLLVVVYLRAHLERILLDLCGTAERAKFWTIFSNIMLMLTPLIFAMSYQPELGPGRTAVFELGNQLRLGLAGIVVSVLVVGLMLRGFIPPVTVRRSQSSLAQRKAQSEATTTTQQNPPETPISTQRGG